MVVSFALFSAAAAAEETGAFEIITSFMRIHFTIEQVDRTVTGGSMHGTTTITRSDGVLFLEGESSIVECVFYGTRTEAGLELEAPCQNTDTEGDMWFWIARRSAGDMESGGQGRRELQGGTGKYAGVKGECTYITSYLSEDRIVSVAECEWNRP